MTRIRAFIAVIAGVILTLFTRNMSFVWNLLTYSSAVVVGACVGFYYSLSKGKVFETDPKPPQTGVLLKLLMERASDGQVVVKRQQSVINRNTDAAVEEILNLIIEDYVMYFLKDITTEHDKLRDMIRDDMWIVVKNIHEAMSKIDQVKFVTSDVTNKLCQHYQKIRISSLGDSKEQKPVFYLRHYLQTPETELEFLRKVSEALMVVWLPQSYASCEPVRHLLREILACQVLYPTIEMICDPDYINQKLLEYLVYQQEMLEYHKKTYAFADTFEDFIKMISESTDINQLKQMRYKIMSEIMQSTTMGNLKKKKGMNIDKEFNPQSGHKGDLLQARNLKRYINQLTTAKNRCEQKIKCLGGPDYLAPSSPAEDCHEELSPNVPGRTVLSYQVVMESPHARHYFMRFLEEENFHSYLGFWEAVEMMRQANKEIMYEDGNKVYKTYIINSTLVMKHLDKNILKAMEAFLTGDKTPEAFYTAQSIIAHELEERHYHRFIVSDWYHKMMKTAEEHGISFLSGNNEHPENDGSDDMLAEDSSTLHDIYQLTDHSSFARDKLQHLNDKLANKTQALHAILGSQNCDTKAVLKLQKEIDLMTQEKKQLESHIARTEIWSDNFENWRVRVTQGEIIVDRDKQCPCFHLHVYLKGNEDLNDEHGISNWFIVKKLSEVMELHRKLTQIAHWIKYTELPKEGKTLFKNYDRAYLEKAKHLLQSYLNQVMEDDKLNKSECLYMFLSPSPGFFIQLPSSPKKARFFFSNFFKGTPTASQHDGSDEDEFLFWDEDSGSIRDDPIAEPLFTLISEIFDMRGVFKMLRRKLMRLSLIHI